MKLIIAGGRDYELKREDYEWLDSLCAMYEVSEIVSGGATGADAGGEQFAISRQLPVKRFPANWKTYGRSAGPIRNRAMAEYADAVALFPGGRGTQNMRDVAIENWLQVFEQDSAK